MTNLDLDLQAALDPEDAASAAELEAGFIANGPSATPEPTTQPAPSGSTPPVSAQPDASTSTEMWTADDHKTFKMMVGDFAGLKLNVDKAFGKMGGIERVLRDVQTSTPKGGAVEIPDDVVADLARDYPEFAPYMLSMLKKAATALRGTAQQPVGTAAPAIKPEDISVAVKTRVQEMQAEELADRHPDWLAIVGGVDQSGRHDPKNPFRAWLAKQPAAYQTKINQTDSAGVISGAIDRFQKETRKPAGTPAPASAAVAAHQARLRDATTPRGDGQRPNRTPQSPQDAFLEGFNG